MKFRVYFFLFLLVVYSPTSYSDEPLHVSMIQLIANPDEYQGKVIRFIGFLKLAFEGNVIYVHREDYERAIIPNGVWVDIGKEMYKSSRKLSGHYVIVEGQFNAKDKGHMGMWSGTVTAVQRLDRWEMVR
ncbi:MAG: hypothetical protein ACXV8O_03505 [Methylobacter sp.]